LKSGGVTKVGTTVGLTGRHMVVIEMLTGKNLEIFRLIRLTLL
jgi:hypothetical protein